MLAPEGSLAGIHGQCVGWKDQRVRPGNAEHCKADNADVMCK